MQDFERKETAKFHKIYETLQDLCTKQFKLEENVAAIESEMRAAYMPWAMCYPNGMAMNPGMQSMGFPMVMCAPGFPNQMSPGVMPVPAMAMPAVSGQMPVSMPMSGQIEDAIEDAADDSAEVQTERTESTEAETPTGKDGTKDAANDLKGQMNTVNQVSQMTN